MFWFWAESNQTVISFAGIWLFPVICIVFREPMKIAPHMELSRVTHLIKLACELGDEDCSRHEIVH